MGYASYLAIGYHDSAVQSVTKYDTSDLLPLYVFDCPCRETIQTGLKWYYVQLGLNLLWSPTFFNAKSVSSEAETR